MPWRAASHACPSGLRGMRRRAPRGSGGSTPAIRQGVGGGRTGIALRQRRRDGWDRARRILGAFQTGRGQAGQRGRGQGLRLVWVVRHVGPVTGHDTLPWRVPTRWRVAAILPALGGGAPARQRGSRPGALGLVVGRRAPRWRGVAAACLPRRRPLGRRGGAPLPVGRGCRLGLRLSPPQGRLHLGPARLTAGPRGGQCGPPPAAARRGLRGGLRVGRHHPGRKVLAPTRPCRLPISLTPGRVP